MERYLRFKLGLAILYYAAFCIRPMLVYSQKIDNANKTNNFNDEYVFYQGVQGKPGVDFPVLSHIPKTTFNCRHMESGYYADLDTDCQVFHICEDNKKISFLCPNGTIFQQSELICEWWFKVNCTNSPTLYEESAEQLREDNARRKLSRRVNLNKNNRNSGNNNNINNHGAVMRMEEHSTVSASQNGRNFNVNVIPQQKTASKRVYNVNPSQKHQENDRNDNSNNSNNRISLTVGNNRQKPATRKQNRRKNNQKARNNNNEVRIQDSGDDVVQFTVQKPRIVNTTPVAPSLQEVSSEPTPSVDHFSETLRQTQTNTNPRSNQFQTPSSPPPVYHQHSNSTENYETSSLKRIDSTPQPFHSSAFEENKRITDGNVFNNFNTQPNGNQLSSFHQHNSNSNFEPTTTEITPEKDEVASDIRISFNSRTMSSSTPRPDRQIEAKQSKTELSNKETTKNQEKTTGTLTRNDLLTRRIEPASSDSSAESQIPQETASFYKNSFNQIDNSYKTTTILPSNHRETYEELKEPKYYATKILSAISSVTPQYLTTQPINNGRPFVGSQVGGSGTTRASSTPEVFNVGLTGKTLPPVVSTTTRPPVSFSLPASLFNVGSTATPGRRVQALPLSTPSTPVEASTARVIDHATVYGRFVTSSTPRTTPESLQLDEEVLKTSNTYNTARPLNSISFNSGKGETTALPLLFTSSVATPSSSTTSSGFYVTRKQDEETTIGLTSTLRPSPSTKSGEVMKPRPFQLPPEPSNDLLAPPRNTETSPTIPSYKISSASPFTVSGTLSSTLPTPAMPSTFDNVDSMINALAEMASGDYSGETPRPGLVIPPSAGPQTLHTLAVYFANALDGIAEGKDDEEVTEKGELSQRELDKKKLTALLTQMTMNRYNELFAEDETTTTASSPPENRFEPDEVLEGQHSKSSVQSPKVRQLAKVFTQALSSYLDDPATFKRVLEEVRPTEPSPTLQESEREEPGLSNDDELLNFSDADSKSSFPPIFPTPPAGPRPTWGYLLALNTSGQNLDVKNSLTGSDAENLQLADSQSFVSQFNKLQNDNKKEFSGISTTTSSYSSEGTTESDLQLPSDHWTSSPGVHKLWKTAFSFDPAAINENFDEFTTEIPSVTTEDDLESEEEDVPFRIKVEPHREVQYELRALPKLSLNSTQVHGILIDFMNASSDDETSKLQRILRKLNTTQDEFLEKMREIETNPLTRRLILLLISECGTNATKEIRTEALPIHTLLARTVEREKSKEVLETASSIGGGFDRRSEDGEVKRSSSGLKELVDSSLDDDSQDARALQLLNSLYSIASRFGK